ncbi:hypothetical protein CAURIC_04105 [Corynebacterium auriscanis]|nr:hypothetical protein CAURIC_04105 [Corynebacterium auriscanis]
MTLILDFFETGFPTHGWQVGNFPFSVASVGGLPSTREHLRERIRHRKTLDFPSFTQGAGSLGFTEKEADRGIDDVRHYSLSGSCVARSTRTLPYYRSKRFLKLFSNRSPKPPSLVRLCASRLVAPLSPIRI